MSVVNKKRGVERDEGITPYVLVKGDEMRLSEIPDETFTIMDYFE